MPDGLLGRVMELAAMRLETHFLHGQNETMGKHCVDGISRVVDSTAPTKGRSTQ